jgi:hypothetical protein
MNRDGFGAKMGRRNQDKVRLFYSFDLDAVVPSDHPAIGLPSIGSVLMIRMLIIGYVFAIRSERAPLGNLPVCLNLSQRGIIPTPCGELDTSNEFVPAWFQSSKCPSRRENPTTHFSPKSMERGRLPADGSTRIMMS